MNTPTRCRPRPLWALSAAASTMPCWRIAPSKPKRRQSTPGTPGTIPYAAGKLSRGCVLLRCISLNSTLRTGLAGSTYRTPIRGINEMVRRADHTFECNREVAPTTLLRYLYRKPLLFLFGLSDCRGAEHDRLSKSGAD